MHMSFLNSFLELDWHFYIMVTTFKSSCNDSLVTVFRSNPYDYKNASLVTTFKSSSSDSLVTTFESNPCNLPSRAASSESLVIAFGSHPCVMMVTTFGCNPCEYDGDCLWEQLQWELGDCLQEQPVKLWWWLPLGVAPLRAWWLPSGASHVIMMVTAFGSSSSEILVIAFENSPCDYDGDRLQE